MAAPSSLRHYPHSGRGWLRILPRNTGDQWSRSLTLTLRVKVRSQDKDGARPFGGSKPPPYRLRREAVAKMAQNATNSFVGTGVLDGPQKSAQLLKVVLLSSKRERWQSPSFVRFLLWVKTDRRGRRSLQGELLFCGNKV